MVCGPSHIASHSRHGRFLSRTEGTDASDEVAGYHTDMSGSPIYKKRTNLAHPEPL